MPKFIPLSKKGIGKSEIAIFKKMSKKLITSIKGKNVEAFVFDSRTKLMNNLLKKYSKKLILLCLVAVFITSATIPAHAEDWSFQEDKQLHLAGGVAEGIFFQTFYEFYIAKNHPSVTPWKRHLYAFGLTFVTGSFFNIGKEATDNTFSTADLAYGTGGLIAGAGGTILIFRFTGDFGNWKFGL